MSSRFIAIIALCAAIGASAAEPRVLTLDECRDLALQNNAKMKMADNSAKAAEEVRRQAFTDYFPQISANGLAFKSNKPVIHYDILDLVTLEMIRKGLTANITAIQPLFAGGRIVNGNKLAAVGAEAGKLERDNAADQVGLTVEDYYWQVVTLKSKRRTLDAALALTDTLQRQVQVAVDAGVVLRNELLKVQLRRNELLALQVDLDNGINLASKLLAQYIGLDNEPIDVNDVCPDPKELPPYPADIYIDPQSALPGTNDYRLLNAGVKAAELQQRMAVGENLPTVGVGAGYFYDDLLNEHWSFGAVFVSVSVPISGWWGGSHAIRKSKLEAENARTQRDDLGQMLCIGMQNDWDDLTAAHRKMEIAAESIAQSAENLRLNEDYYHAGVGTVTDVLDAQTLYRQSLDSYTEAYGNFRLARAKYLTDTGRPDF